MKGFTVQDVARMLDLSAAQVRSLARAGFLEPGRGRRGEYRFSFQDLVLLRTAKELRASRVPPRRLRKALARLKQQLPRGRPLSAVQIRAQGDRVFVREGDKLWDPESGQRAFDFEVSELVAKAMAEGALTQSDAALTVAITGVAGPGGSATKAEGDVWFATALKGGETEAHFRAFGAIGRDQVRRDSVLFALHLLGVRLSAR